MLPWNTQFEMECLPQAPRLGSGSYLEEEAEGF